MTIITRMIAALEAETQHGICQWMTIHDAISIIRRIADEGATADEVTASAKAITREFVDTAKKNGLVMTSENTTDTDRRLAATAINAMLKGE